MGPPPFQKKIPKKSQFFLIRKFRIRRDPSPPLSEFFWRKKNSFFFDASPNLTKLHHQQSRPEFKLSTRLMQWFPTKFSSHTSMFQRSASFIYALFLSAIHNNWELITCQEWSNHIWFHFYANLETNRYGCQGCASACFEIQITFGHISYIVSRDLLEMVWPWILLPGLLSAVIGLLILQIIH